MKDKIVEYVIEKYRTSSEMGAIKYGTEGRDVFLGRDLNHQRDYSEDVASAIDEEVRKLIDNAHHEAYAILDNNRAILDKLVVELLEKETLDKEEVAKIFSKLKKRSARPAWTGSSKRKPSKKGPVKAPIRLVKDDESPTSLNHGKETSNKTGAVASQTDKNKK